MFDRANLRIGMTARSADGERLGKVVALGEGQFQVERGYFFPRDYLASYGDIVDIQGSDVILRHGQEELRGVSGRGIVSEAGMGTASAEGSQEVDMRTEGGWDETLRGAGAAGGPDDAPPERH